MVYAGDSFRNRIRLDADEHPVHDWFKKPNPPVPVEFDIPAQATADGSADPDLAAGARQGGQRPGLPGGRGLVDPEVTEALHSREPIHELLTRNPSPSLPPRP